MVEFLSFGDWQKGQVIGKGRFGCIYSGIIISSGEMIAVKEIRVQTHSKTNSKCQQESLEMEKIEREIEIMQHFKHPNIVEYLGAEYNPQCDKVYIFMEYLAIGSMSELVCSFGPLNEDIVGAIALQILKGLVFLHENRVAHRDLKGGNVLISETGAIKLADFGTSKRLFPMEHDSSKDADLIDTARSAREGIGTVNWMSPEIIRAQTGIDMWRKADVWSLGCTIIEMATGHPPWDNFSNPMTVMYHIASGEELPKLPENFSNCAQDFLKCCFEIDVQLRKPASELLYHPFLVTDNKTSSNLGDHITLGEQECGELSTKSIQLLNHDHLNSTEFRRSKIPCIDLRSGVMETPKPDNLLGSDQNCAIESKCIESEPLVKWAKKSSSKLDIHRMKTQGSEQNDQLITSNSSTVLEVVNLESNHSIIYDKAFLKTSDNHPKFCCGASSKGIKLEKGIIYPRSLFLILRYWLGQARLNLNPCFYSQMTPLNNHTAVYAEYYASDKRIYEEHFTTTRLTNSIPLDDKDDHENSQNAYEETTDHIINEAATYDYHNYQYQDCEENNFHQNHEVWHESGYENAYSFQNCEGEGYYNEPISHDTTEGFHEHQETSLSCEEEYYHGNEELWYKNCNDGWYEACNGCNVEANPMQDYEEIDLNHNTAEPWLQCYENENTTTECHNKLNAIDTISSPPGEDSDKNEVKWYECYEEGTLYSSSGIDLPTTNCISDPQSCEQVSIDSNECTSFDNSYQVRVLADYCGNVKCSELHLIENEVLQVLEETDTGWWYGKNQSTNQIGWFPCTYVEWIL